MHEYQSNRVVSLTPSYQVIYSEYNQLHTSLINQKYLNKSYYQLILPRYLHVEYLLPEPEPQTVKYYSEVKKKHNTQKSYLKDRFS